MIVLLRAEVSRHSIDQKGSELMNAGQRSPQFVRYVREKLILEFQLLLSAHLQRAQQSLPLHRIAHGPFQTAAGDCAFYQIILHPLMQGLRRQRFIVLS